MCRHALSYHLPAGLQPRVRRGPAGQSTGLFLQLAHAWTPIPRKAPRGQGKLPCQTSWARATCWHTWDTCTQAGTNLALCHYMMCALWDTPPLYKQNLRQKAPPNIGIRELSQTPGFSTLCSLRDTSTWGRLLDRVLDPTKGDEAGGGGDFYKIEQSVFEPLLPLGVQTCDSVPRLLTSRHL